MLTNFHLDKGKDMNLSESWLRAESKPQEVIPEHLQGLENVKPC